MITYKIKLKNKEVELNYQEIKELYDELNKIFGFHFDPIIKQNEKINPYVVTVYSITTISGETT